MEDLFICQQYTTHIYILIYLYTILYQYIYK